MTYQETLDYLFTALPMYQRIGASAYKADLENANKLDNYFNHPHKKFKSIHIAGTNGKGSVSHMLSSVLQEAGYKTGLYTSPHLLDFRERIKINGREVSEDFVVSFTLQHKGIFESLQASFFEMTVFMAFDYFATEEVDVAIIEVGLGGRLDTTNIIDPILSVITNIGFDHTQFLGNTLDSIAREKAGIIKPEKPVVIGETQDETASVFTEMAKGKSAHIFFADQMAKIEYQLREISGIVNYRLKHEFNFSFTSLQSDLEGNYQGKNIITSLASLSLLRPVLEKISEKAVLAGLKSIIKNTGLSGRWQRVAHNPLIVVDVAHNLEGFQLVLEQISLTPHKNLHMILGFVNDKNLEKLVSILPSDAQYYISEPNIPRRKPKEEVFQIFRANNLKAELTNDIGSAVLKARENAETQDFIYIGGSSFLVADFLSWKKSQKTF